MSVALALTTFSVLRSTVELDPDEPTDVDPWGEGYDDDADGTPDRGPDVWATLALGVRGTLAAPRGQALPAGQKVEYALACDPTELRFGDRVIDDTTGRTYAVQWSVESPGVAGLLASTQAGLYEIQGFGQEEAQT